MRSVYWDVYFDGVKDFDGTGVTVSPRVSSQPSYIRDRHIVALVTETVDVMIHSPFGYYIEKLDIHRDRTKEEVEIFVTDEKLSNLVPHALEYKEFAFCIPDDCIMINVYFKKYENDVKA